MNDFLGQEAVKAWLIIAAVFAAGAVLGLVFEWDGVTRSSIIGGSIALFASLAAIALDFGRVERR